MRAAWWVRGALRVTVPGPPRRAVRPKRRRAPERRDGPPSGEDAELGPAFRAVGARAACPHGERSRGQWTMRTAVTTSTAELT